MGKASTPSEQRIVLEKVSWQKFESLLAEMPGQRSARFTYDRGRLEMMNPLDEHERCRKLIESLILVLVDEMQLRIEGYVAPVLKRADLQRGIEPDACYYLQHEREMRGKSAIDLADNPPPDLVQEALLTKSSLNNLSIYASFGVPEVWRYVTQPGEENFFKGTLQIYCLEGDRYVESTHGFAFPFLPATKILEFVEQSDTLGLMTALRVLRAWVQDVVDE